MNSRLSKSGSCIKHFALKKKACFVKAGFFFKIQAVVLDYLRIEKESPQNDLLQRRV